MVERTLSTTHEGTAARRRSSLAGAVTGSSQGPFWRSGERSRAQRAETPSRRRRWKSPLTRRILTVNVLALLIPVIGLLHLDQYRLSLITSELEALETQGKAFALSLGSTAASSGQSAEERLLPDMTRQLMRVLLSGSGIRARAFGLDGELIADSFLLMGSGGQVQVIELPPPDDGSVVGVSEKVMRIRAWSGRNACRIPAAT